MTAYEKLIHLNTANNNYTIPDSLKTELNDQVFGLKWCSPKTGLWQIIYPR
jgi:hypothetical protein